MKYKLLFLLSLVPSICMLFQALDVPMMGLFGDDTIYYSSAKSLAEGEGYRLPSLQGQPFQTKYPPLFPLMLSAVWKANPEYPANLPLAAVIAWLAVPIYLYLAWQIFLQLNLSESTALTAVFVLALNGQVLLFGSMLMSEIWFSCGVLAAILAASKSRYWQAGVLAGLAYLIKSSALPFLVTLPVVILLQQRDRHGLRAAAKAFVPMFVAVLGWNLWARAYAVKSTDISLLYNTSYLGYYLHEMTPAMFWNLVTTNFRLLYFSIPRMLVLDPSGSTFETIITLFVLLAGSAGVLHLVRGSRQRWHYPLFALAYMAQLVAWNFAPTPRLLLPVLPLLLAGIGSTITSALEVLNSNESMLRPRSIVSLVTLMLFGPLALFLGIVSFGMLFVNLPATMRENREALAAKLEAYDWIRKNTPASAAVLANDDQLLYLYTGRRSASQILPALLYYRDNNDAALRAELAKLPDYARERRLDYVLVTSTDLRRENLEKYRPELDSIMQASASGYRLVFDRPNARIYSKMSY